MPSVVWMGSCDACPMSNEDLGALDADDEAWTPPVVGVVLAALNPVIDLVADADGFRRVVCPTLIEAEGALKDLLGLGVEIEAPGRM